LIDCVWHHWIHSFVHFLTHILVFLFFHSVTQALKEEEGMEVVLMNPNIASVQTNTDDKSPARPTTSFPPVTPTCGCIKKEKPDGIVAHGGQTAPQPRR
jgi:carbamoylphosphate synthase large subunit